MTAHAKSHAPLALFETTVGGDWVDYNGHMNDAAFAIVFSRSVDALMDRVGLDAAARKRTSQTLFTLQMMLHYFREAKEGDALAVACHLLEHDDKRMRVWLAMTATGSGETIAASEQLLISVAQGDTGAHAVPWSFETLAALDALGKTAQRAAASAAGGCGRRAAAEVTAATLPLTNSVRKTGRGAEACSEGSPVGPLRHGPASGDTKWRLRWSREPAAASDFATAVALARAGHTVVATMRNLERGAKIRKIAAEERLPVHLAALDVDDDASVREAFAKVAVARHGPIDVLVNNAGVPGGGAVEETPLDEFRRVMETNFFGGLRCIKAVVASMRERRRGTIVNVTSIAGRTASAPMASYAASKWAFEALSECLAQEMRAFNVRVAVVEPGVIATPIFRKGAALLPDSPYPHARRLGAMFAAALAKPTPPSLVAELIRDIVDGDSWQLRYPAGPDAVAGAEAPRKQAGRTGHPRSRRERRRICGAGQARNRSRREAVTGRGGPRAADEVAARAPRRPPSSRA